MVKGDRPRATTSYNRFFFKLTLTMHLLGEIAVCTEIYTAILKHLQTLDTKFMNILSLKNTKSKFKLF